MIFWVPTLQTSLYLGEINGTNTQHAISKRIHSFQASRSLLTAHGHIQDRSSSICTSTALVLGLHNTPSITNQACSHSITSPYPFRDEVYCQYVSTDRIQLKI